MNIARLILFGRTPAPAPAPEPAVLAPQVLDRLREMREDAEVPESVRAGAQVMIDCIAQMPLVIVKDGEVVDTPDPEPPQRPFLFALGQPVTFMRREVWIQGRMYDTEHTRCLYDLVDARGERRQRIRESDLSPRAGLPWGEKPSAFAA